MFVFLPQKLSLWFHSMDNESCLHMPPVPRNIQETTKLKWKHYQFPVLMSDKLSPKIEAKIFLKCGEIAHCQSWWSIIQSIFYTVVIGVCHLTSQGRNWWWNLLLGMTTSSQTSCCKTCKQRTQHLDQELPFYQKCGKETWEISYHFEERKWGQNPLPNVHIILYNQHLQQVSIIHGFLQNWNSWRDSSELTCK